MMNLSALRGAIVFAWFPEDENPHVAGPKYRPTLIVDINQSKMMVRLAYGTSQNTFNRRKGDITFEKHEIEGLSADTKFSLAKTKWVSLTPEMFFRDKQHSKLSVIGFTPSNRVRDLMQSIEEIDI